jgi:predicted amidohydrolase
MKKTIRVAAIQRNIYWESRDSNLNELDTLFELLPADTDIVLLAEMFATGFSMNAEANAEPMDGTIVQWMHAKARQYNCAVGGSVIIEENGNFYNRFVWATPDEIGPCYDKRHLFPLSGEDKPYTAGLDRLIIKYQGWRIMPQICYDLRFPVWSRNDSNYDLLIYVANWPSYRTNAWRSLLVARAIENQSYVVGVNRIGYDDEKNPFPGNSVVIDYNGSEIIHVADGTHVISAELDKNEMHQFRSEYDFLNDRDAFVIQ